MTRDFEDDIVGLAEALRSGHIDAVDHIESTLERIERQRSLNAFLYVDAEGAWRAARESAHRLADGRPRALEGIPVGVKDNLDVAAMPTTGGMTGRTNTPASEDAGAVARLRAAGAIIVGKLHMNEAALGADGRNPHFGPARNPLDCAHVSGGSSSGSAVAVAAGLVPAALGSDTMGSIRIPAAYCGVWGLKPSFGQVSTAGSIAVSRRLDHIGPLARSARDLSLLLDVMAGFDPACPVSMPWPAQADPPPDHVTLGRPDLSDIELEPAVREAFDRALEAFQAAGHRVIDLPAPPDPGVVRRAGLLVCEAEMRIEHNDSSTFSRQLRDLLTWVDAQPASAFARALRQLDEARLAVNRWLSACDLVVLPTAPQRAFALDRPTPVNQADLTCLASAAATPALSLPLSDRDGGLPSGLQLIAAHGCDRMMIIAAGMLAPLVGAGHA